jgi:hypothetical protein
MTTIESAPELSVVIGLISGRIEDLSACLRALDRQEDAPRFEILVPYDDPCAAVTRLQQNYPAVRFLHAHGLDSAQARAGASREHHDTLRTIGLRVACGRYVVLTEDHAVQDPRWCRALVDALEAHPEVAAFGGAVDCQSSRLLNWAVYFCDFGRYQNPVPEGPAHYVSDSNVAYRREALSAVQAAWDSDYRETVVHRALVEKGDQIWLTPKAVVWQARSGLRLGAALRERYVWGRSFAWARVLGAPLSRRAIYAAFSFVLPFLLTFRLARVAFSRGRSRSMFFACLPLVFLLNVVWAYGEFVGYATGRPAAAASAPPRYPETTPSPAP